MNSTKIAYISFGWHSFFLALTMAMIDFNTVFPSLISELSKSKLAFGFLYAILLGAPYFFNMLFSHLMNKYHFKKKFLIIGIYLRALAFLGMSISVFLFAQKAPALVLVLFVLWIFIFSASAGFAGLSYSNLVAKLIPSGNRGQFYAVKQFIGSSASIIGGFVVGRIFKNSGLLYPYNFAIALFIGFIGLVISSLGFYAIKEPSGEIEETHDKFSGFLKKVPNLLKTNREFLNYIIVENLSSISLMILPFYMFFAKEKLGAGQEYIGRYLIFQISGMVISNILWGLFIKKRDSKTAMGYCIAIGAALPILAIILSNFGPKTFSILFIFIGFVMSGRRITFDPYLLDIIPSNNRVTFLGIRGTLNILVIILPLVGASIIKLFGYNIAFIMVTGVMLYAFYRLKKITI